MDKKELINEIIDLYDENEGLRTKIALLTPRSSEIVSEQEKDNLRQEISDYIALKGQKAIIGYNTLFETAPTKVYDDEEHQFLPLSTWLSLVAVRDYDVIGLPSIIKDNVPRKELKKVFALYLKEKYRESVDAKKAELLEVGEPKTETVKEPKEEEK